MREELLLAKKNVKREARLTPAQKADLRQRVSRKALEHRNGASWKQGQKNLEKARKKGTSLSVFHAKADIARKVDRFAEELKKKEKTAMPELSWKDLLLRRCNCNGKGVCMVDHAILGNTEPVSCYLCFSNFRPPKGGLSAEAAYKLLLDLLSEHQDQTFAGFRNDEDAEAWYFGLNRPESDGEVARKEVKPKSKWSLGGMFASMSAAATKNVQRAAEKTYGKRKQAVKDSPTNEAPSFRECKCGALTPNEDGVCMPCAVARGYKEVEAIRRGVKKQVRPDHVR